jgi:hypothetical protein
VSDSHDQSLLEEAKQKHAESVARLDEINARIKALPDDAPTDEVEFLRASFEKETATSKRWAEAAERTEIIQTVRSAVKPQNSDAGVPDATPRIEVKEPLTYRKLGDHHFFIDVARSKLQGDVGASERLQRHAAEMRVEMRDISNTAGAGGEFVPPLYLQGAVDPAAAGVDVRPPTSSTKPGAPAWCHVDHASAAARDGRRDRDPHRERRGQRGRPDHELRHGERSARSPARSTCQPDAVRAVAAGPRRGAVPRPRPRLRHQARHPGAVRVRRRPGQALGIRNVSGVNAIAAGTTATPAAVLAEGRVGDLASITSARS